MISQWYDIKKKALALRRAGNSLGHIHQLLNIPRSTLSGWFRTIVLTANQKNKLDKNWREGLIKARKKAVMVHNEQKRQRFVIAQEKALEVLNQIDSNSSAILDVTLATLYLGEGSKKNGTGMGNSDPLILKFFIKVLQKNYNISISKLCCELHLRADQDMHKMKEYWSTTLEIPLENFKSVSFDKRTLGSKTYPNYNGVCLIRYGDVAIQRKLMYLSKLFCEKVITQK